MRIYFAGPLFTLAEVAFNRQVVNELRHYGHQVFLPQEHEVQHGDTKAIFNADVEGILEAQAVVACMDGADPDSGTCWEVGYAYAKQIPVLLFRTDFRKGGERGAPFNLMMSECARKVLKLPHEASTCWIGLAIHEALKEFPQ